MVLTCTCPHTAQDQLHGYAKRVHNLAKHNTVARCTVCKKEKPLTKEQAKNLNKEE